MSGTLLTHLKSPVFAWIALVSFHVLSTSFTIAPLPTLFPTAFPRLSCIVWRESVGRQHAALWLPNAVAPLGLPFVARGPASLAADVSGSA